MSAAPRGAPCTPPSGIEGREEEQVRETTGGREKVRERLQGREDKGEITGEKEKVRETTRERE
jgi:hypothetical protein